MNVSLKNIFRYKKYSKVLFRIILKKPMIIFRILNNYFKIVVLKQKVVRKVEIGVTFDCQCSCPKCSSYFMRNSEMGNLTLQEIRKVAREIINLGAIQINLTGGEPLMEKNIFEIIKCFQPNKVIITITTNGLLLSTDLIDKLEKAGVDIIKISIDSPIAEEHDFSRGFKGCFAQGVKMLSYIKKKRVLGMISTVCIKENINTYRIAKLVEMARKYDALLGLTIPAVVGRWLGKEEVLLDDKEKEVLGKLIEIPHVIRDTDEAYLRSHCPAGSEEFYLTCYGDIIPCSMIQISFGNVKEENLKSIWKKMLNFGAFKNKKEAGCLAGENKDFINEYLLPLKNYRGLPLQIENHPAIQGSRNVIEKNS